MNFKAVLHPTNLVSSSFPTLWSIKIPTFLNDSPYPFHLKPKDKFIDPIIDRLLNWASVHSIRFAIKPGLQKHKVSIDFKKNRIQPIIIFIFIKIYIHIDDKGRFILYSFRIFEFHCLGWRTFLCPLMTCFIQIMLFVTQNEISFDDQSHKLNYKTILSWF